MLAELVDCANEGVDNAPDKVLVSRRGCHDVLSVRLDDEIGLDEKLLAWVRETSIPEFIGERPSNSH